MSDTLKTQIIALPSGISSKVDFFTRALSTGTDNASITALSVASGVATATTSTDHDYHDKTIVEISGATPAELNGRFRVNVLNATQFSFATLATDGAASGTIVCKASGAGWEVLYSAAGKVALRAPVESGSPGWVFRINDSDSTIKMYRSMTDIDTGSELVATHYTTAMPTRIVADSRSALVFHTLASSGVPDAAYMANFLGDLVSFSATDLHLTMLSFTYPSIGFSGEAQGFLLFNNTAVGQSRLARNSSGTVSTASTARFLFFRNAGHSSSRLIGAGDSYVLDGDQRPAGPVFVADVNSGKIRGEVPGVRAISGYISAATAPEEMAILLDQHGAAWARVRLRNSKSNGGSADNHNGMMLVSLADWR